MHLMVCPILSFAGYELPDRKFELRKSAIDNLLVVKFIDNIFTFTKHLYGEIEPKWPGWECDCDFYETQFHINDSNRGHYTTSNYLHFKILATREKCIISLCILTKYKIGGNEIKPDNIAYKVIHNINNVSIDFIFRKIIFKCIGDYIGEHCDQLPCDKFAAYCKSLDG